jgi:predicted Zn-dependent protease with MMP-like domain
MVEAVQRPILLQSKDMITVSDEAFARLINEAWESLPGEHVRNLKNVAITWEDDPSPEQRVESHLAPNQTLFGLYQGVPLSQRQGILDKTLPDKITLYRGPLSAVCSTVEQLKEQIRHTLWHEIGHYYGLNHAQIHERERSD